jgi:hypothetical protein
MLIFQRNTLPPPHDLSTKDKVCVIYEGHKQASHSDSWMGIVVTLILKKTTQCENAKNQTWIYTIMSQGEQWEITEHFFKYLVQLPILLTRQIVTEWDNLCKILDSTIQKTDNFHTVAVLWFWYFWSTTTYETSMSHA